MDEKSLLGKNLLLFTAHPDDESFAAGGTIYKNYVRGGRTNIVCATLGERGKSHLQKPVTDSALKAIRRQELRQASRFMHANKVHILGLPDGGVADFKSRLYSDFLGFAERYRPDVLVSFDKSGISGHRDHIAVGAAAARVARRLQIPLCVFCPPPLLKKMGKKWLWRRRKHGKYIPLGRVSHTEANLKIRVNPARKEKILLSHASQLDTGGVLTKFPKKIREQWLKFEYFCFYVPRDS